MSGEITFETDPAGRVKTIKLAGAPQWLDDTFVALGESMRLGFAARDDGDLDGCAALLRAAVRKCDLLSSDSRVELLAREAFSQLRADLAAAAPSEVTYPPPIPVPDASLTVPERATKRVAFERDGSSATVHVWIQPFVAWIWIGGLIMALGAILALMPPTRRQPRRRPAELDDAARQQTKPELEVVA